MGILVITTGGTIGALPYEDPRQPPELSAMPSDGVDFVHGVLKEDFKFAAASYISFSPRDSKLIDNDYRKAILAIIEEAKEDKILITHGTDTILQTAQFFYEQSKTNKILNGKVIIITGAMVPLSNGHESDGYLNLEYSLKQLPSLAGRDDKKNIYIVLCDQKDSNSMWEPHLYHYEPDHYEKVYAEDARYNRLKRVK
ncbi:MAG: asparaginase domain-containing protein [Alphaproteobacteria bacterium]|nr:asparaginase domain-containing protein [Alphaproteobacteria bacterium]